ncbi:MAG: CDP-alcohol phosphatidyltransferase family protein [Rhodobacter sp.]|uniref:CDP-alcohol phosphatidyltransferase family protein n=1 Tax=Pararhodobacter sp. TaxID=2127056 RepID=UPI001D2273FC|nr:phosphatidylcholine synthase [Pararhodobacter sp.]MCB1345392.1 CDP-alcohol phosphatidyltransferase family protein [Paracoccaceae bacterium]MCB1408655.1 CDP-alcohol phosphatidyltransferase family protein [Paracoccaceae bacterium]MCC0073035.1 CDP-alcohol phosphatidyltransferase family protein [Rhodobacter sp.]HPD91970.1 CDP-alcohol phosphatidyltransferase family protein [Pararhodobacter sp.]
MSETFRAYFVHMFTATGAVFSMLAMLAAADAKWSLMFLWLVVAFVVDGIDGPMARKYDVKHKAPIIDGVLLDLIIDYLTYVFIPAFALFQSGLLPGWSGWVAIIVITFASVLYFADTRMKTADNSFSGFPGCWNMLAVVVFATRPEFWVLLGLIVVLSVTMFLRIKFVHPVRTRRWRTLTLPIALIWVAAATWAAWMDFAQPRPVTLALIASSIYLLAAGAVQQVLYRERL